MKNQTENTTIIRSKTNDEGLKYRLKMGQKIKKKSWKVLNPNSTSKFLMI